MRVSIRMPPLSQTRISRSKRKHKHNKTDVNSLNLDLLPRQSPSILHSHNVNRSSSSRRSSSSNNNNNNNNKRATSLEIVLGREPDQITVHSPLPTYLTPIPAKPRRRRRQEDHRRNTSTTTTRGRAVRIVAMGDL